MADHVEARGAPERMPRAIKWFLIATALAFLVLVWPGGLILNRVEPTLLGLPFYVGIWLVVTPITVITINAVHLIAHWGNDRQYMERLAQTQAVDTATDRASSVREHTSEGEE